jgi:hypothetical protein
VPWCVKQRRSANIFGWCGVLYVSGPARETRRNVTIHLTGGLPMGSAKDIDTAKAEFKAAWEALKARITPEQLASAYKAMNIRDDG